MKFSSRRVYFICLAACGVLLFFVGCESLPVRSSQKRAAAADARWLEAEKRQVAQTGFEPVSASEAWSEVWVALHQLAKEVTGKEAEIRPGLRVVYASDVKRVTVLVQPVKADASLGLKTAIFDRVFLKQMAPFPESRLWRLVPAPSGDKPMTEPDYVFTSHLIPQLPDRNVEGWEDQRVVFAYVWGIIDTRTGEIVMEHAARIEHLTLRPPPPDSPEWDKE